MQVSTGACLTDDPIRVIIGTADPRNPSTPPRDCAKPVLPRVLTIADAPSIVDLYSDDATQNVVAAVNNRWLRSDHRLPARAFIETLAAELEGAAVVVHLDSGAEAIPEFGSGRKYRAQPLRPFPRGLR